MSKLSKSVLKEIIKECLIEILAEGLAPKHPAKASKRVSRKPQDKLIEAFAGGKLKGTIQNRKQKDSTHSQEKEEIISRVNSVTSDPILAEMLADTAQTTLKEQVAADRNRNFQAVSRQGDEAAKAVDSSTPEDIFGEETAGKWATLAFG